jgi:type II secretory pathway pseudopilin PulG
MVRVGPEGEFLRRRALWLDLPPRAQPLLQRFVEGRLLVSRGEGGERVVEVAHEALLRSWPRLEDWLREDRDNLRLLDDMLRAAEAWDTNGRKPSWLNHLGERLAAAEAMARTPRFAAQLDDTARAYLDACIAREKKGARVRRIATGVIVVFAIAAGIAAVVAFYQTNEALHLSRMALMRLLAVQARQHMQQAGSVDQLERAVALTVESISRAENLRMLWPADADAAARVLDGQLPVARFEHGARVSSVAWSPYGGWLATGGEDGVVKLWATDGGGIPVSLAHGASINSLYWAPDGNRLAALASDNIVTLWAVDSGSEPIRLEHGTLVRSVAWSPDGGRLATGGEDGVAELWAADGGGKPVRLEHGDRVYSVAWSPDGRRLATGDWNGVVKLWAADGHLLIARLCSLAGRNLTRTEWNTYIGADEPWRPTCPNWRNPQDVEPDQGGARSD